MKQNATLVSYLLMGLRNHPQIALYKDSYHGDVYVQSTNKVVFIITNKKDLVTKKVWSLDRYYNLLLLSHGLHDAKGVWAYIPHHTGRGLYEFVQKNPSLVLFRKVSQDCPVVTLDKTFVTTNLNKLYPFKGIIDHDYEVMLFNMSFPGVNTLKGLYAQGINPLITWIRRRKVMSPASIKKSKDLIQKTMWVTNWNIHEIGQDNYQHKATEKELSYNNPAEYEVLMADYRHSVLQSLAGILDTFWDYSGVLDVSIEDNQVLATIDYERCLEYIMYNGETEESLMNFLTSLQHEDSRIQIVGAH